MKQICRMLLGATALLAATEAGPAQTRTDHDVRVTPDGGVVVDGRAFRSWVAYVNSDFFRENGMRCGTPRPKTAAQEKAKALAEAGAGGGGSPGDCTLVFTNDHPDYDPGVVKYYIPVVVHVLQMDDGTGYLDEATIRSQIAVLNEDFLARFGSNGEPGTDVQIEFYLATVDPQGNATSGITYSVNNSWFNDGGYYYNELAWDTDRYLNIYTNTAGGYLGYVPGLPQEGLVGTNGDRVVVNYQAFGRNSPLVPYHLGRTATHEVGHYLGLYHVFNGCGTEACNSSGDFVCDTNPQSSPNFGCASGDTCGVEDSFHNYMDYVDDPCMDNFSPVQARRMRCTLENWRPMLGLLAPYCPSPPAVDCNNNCILDAEEVGDGRAADCNENGIPDDCDLSGPAIDCNANGVPDECEDCNGNGIADPCEFTGQVGESSGPLGPIGLGATVSHLFTAMPDSVGDVTLTFDAVANIGSRFQTLEASLNDAPIGTLYADFVNGDCAEPPARDQLVLTAAQYNSLLAAGGGNATVVVATFDGVDPAFCGGTSSIEVAIEYAAATEVADANGNGVPDECDLARGDSNLDGVVDIQDLLALLARWGACPDPCPEDSDGNGMVDIADLLNLLGGWG